MVKKKGIYQRRSKKSYRAETKAGQENRNGV